MSRIAWILAPRTGPELYEQIEVPEPGDPGYPSAELPTGYPRAEAVNQIRAEIETDYALRTNRHNPSSQQTFHGAAASWGPSPRSVPEGTNR